MVDHQGDSGVAAGALPFPFDRYIPDPDVFSSADDYPPNSCYLSKITPSRPELGDFFLSLRQQQSQSGSQQAAPVKKWPIKPFSNSKGGRLYFKSGVFDLSSCKFGAPVLLSYPHFLHAHTSYRENVDGLRPNPDKHQFSLLVEPRTGTPLATSARIQINLYISKPPWISRFRYIPEIVFPVFWQEMSAQVPPDVREHLAWALTTPFALADIVSLVFILLGLVLVARSAWILVRSESAISGADSSDEFQLQAAKVAGKGLDDGNRVRVYSFFSFANFF